MLHGTAKKKFQYKYDTTDSVNKYLDIGISKNIHSLSGKKDSENQRIIYGDVVHALVGII